GRTYAYVEGRSATTSAGEDWARTLFRIDLDTAEPVKVKFGSTLTNRIFEDDAGNAVALSDYTNVTGHWSLVMHLGDAWKEVYSEDALIDPPGILGVTPDGS